MQSIAAVFLAIYFFTVGCASIQTLHTIQMADLLDKIQSKQQTPLREEYEKLCKAEVRSACVQNGLLAETEGDHDTSQLNFQKACDLGSEVGCYWLGVKHFSKGRLPDAKLLFRKTALDFQSARINEGIVELMEKNESKATQIFENECNLKSADGCVLRGIVAEGNGQFKAARSFYEKSCQLNSATGCSYQGLMEILVGDSTRGRQLVALDCANSGGKACRVEKNLTEIRSKPELPKRWNIQCQQGNAQACYDLGLYQSTNLKMRPISGSTLERACSLGNGLGCLEQANLSMAFRDYDKISQLLIEACDKKIGSACYAQVDGIYPIKVKRDSNIEEKACQFGDGKACQAIGTRELNLSRKENALKYYELACSLKDTTGCFNKVLNFVESDNERLLIFRRSCDKNDALACGGAGNVSYKMGKSEQSLKFFSKACRLHDLRSCAWEIIVRHELDGKYEKKTAEKALCEIGYGYACMNVGYDLNVAGDMDNARSAFQKGCSVLDAESCAYLAYMDAKNNRPAEALKHYRMACDLGSATGCRNSKGEP